MSSAERLTQLWEDNPGVWGSITTVDHKKIGIRYIVTALCFLLVGGVEALMIRLQIARPNQHIMTPETYDQLFSMHGITMIFWYAQLVLSGFSNYFVPLLIGARDMAFPRLNAFTYWMFLLSGLFLYAHVPIGQAPDAGWFAYIPYSTERFSPGLNIDFYALALIFLAISTTAGAINLIVTIFRLRAPGMTVSRMPLLMYSTLTMSFSIVFSLPALTVACVFLELDRRWGTHFFELAHGGNAMLWQHLFWFFGHPWVYIVFLPATGIISMIIQVFAQRPIVGYPYIAAATVLAGIVGFSAWVHHMVATGMTYVSMGFFSAASMTILIFSVIQVFACIATLWTGTPVLTASLLFALGFLASLVIGGLNGIVTAVIPFDWQLTDTYFIVTHLHYVLVGTNIFPVFAGLYYWFPKMTGRMSNERLGAWSFWLMFIGFNISFFPMHTMGLQGMPRRLNIYPSQLGWGTLNMIATIGATVFALGVVVSLWNFLVSWRHGAAAGADPWRADTLEWSIASPPEAYAFVHLPTVRSRHPLWDDHDEEHDPYEERLLDQGRLTFATSWLYAEPQSLSTMPESTVTPLLLALAFTTLFTAFLLQALWVALAALVFSLAITGAWLWPEPEPHPV